MVTFGWGFDQANDLLISLGGTDLRRELTDLVAGDIGKALSQASAWEHAAQSLAAVRGQPARRAPAASARSWEGEAASWSRAYTDAWVGALGLQSEALAAIAAHLRDAVAQAVDVAQIVVDLIREVVVIAGLAAVVRVHPDLWPGPAGQQAQGRPATCLGCPEGGGRLLVLPGLHEGLLHRWPLTP